MKVRIEGYKKVDYVSKKTNKPVRGWNLYIKRDPSDFEVDRYGVVGQVCEDIYMPESFDITSICVGFDYDVYYNRFGGVDRIVPV